jgi:hypothetical protein
MYYGTTLEELRDSLPLDKKPVIHGLCSCRKSEKIKSVQIVFCNLIKENAKVLTESSLIGTDQLFVPSGNCILISSSCMTYNLRFVRIICVYARKGGGGC